jgi:hypothetical protein
MSESIQSIFLHLYRCTHLSRLIMEKFIDAKSCLVQSDNTRSVFAPYHATILNPSSRETED